jgi:D-glycero-D-manno-heptose 1,7-bisphosphate phosphatase
MSTSANRAVFLDRDGVLNKVTIRNGKPYPPNAIDELALLPGVENACILLKEVQYLLIVVTNQPDIARGKKSVKTVNEINEFLQQKLSLDDVRVCPHVNADRCNCRKPKPGHLLDAATDFDIDLSRSIMVGDRWGDVGAGKNAGCKTVFIDYGYREQRPHNPDHTCHDFLSAVQWILKDENE